MALTATSALLASRVWAEAMAPSSPSSENARAGTVTPPRLGSKSEIPYPAAGTGGAVVVLAVTVGADGRVRDVRVLAGDEPFASAASTAARSFRFEPALREGRPITAIIRYEARFEAPRAAPAPTAPTPPASAAAPPQPAASEVVVTGVRQAPDERTLSRAEVRELPGAFADPFRAIEVLPGVTPMASGAPFFYVRGAPPGNVGYFLDGVRVPYLYHIGLGPSVIHPALVERVDLYGGGYPARFGRFAGGIVSGETTEPRTDLHGEANVRLFDAGAIVESGFAGGRGTALVGGRYSYSAAIVSLVAPDVKLDYRDFQARVSYDLSHRDRVSVFSFGSYDVLGEVANGVTTRVFASEFYRADLRYDHAFADGGAMRLAATLGFDVTRIAEDRNGETRLLASRFETAHPLSDRVTVRAGTDLAVEAFGSTALQYDDPENPDVKTKNALFPARNDVAVGSYADLVLKPTRRLEVTPGLRVDLFTSGAARAVGVDPRIAARYEISDDVRITHAYGIVHQAPSFIAPIPGISPGTLANGLQSSFQTSAGIEVDVKDVATAGATVFHNAFFHMSDAAGTSASFDVTALEFNGLKDDRSLGSSVGLELFARRPLTRRVGGFLSYTVSRSMRSLGRET